MKLNQMAAEGIKRWPASKMKRCEDVKGGDRTTKISQSKDYLKEEQWQEGTEHERKREGEQGLYFASGQRENADLNYGTVMFPPDSQQRCHTALLKTITKAKPQSLLFSCLFVTFVKRQS